ncbi:hypothetical protein MG293_007677 [Ovis ammon polii]|uniref:Uncharacterized protein n=1 Tax=Ovis ammon polii TaxID=230172 RepID=A0AAD4U834_OVIAM|nr:hypothetical protein MG293_007677 [Ovis ammon polii]
MDSGEGEGVKENIECLATKDSAAALRSPIGPFAFPLGGKEAAHKQWKVIKCIMKGIDQFDKHFEKTTPAVIGKEMTGVKCGCRCNSYEFPEVIEKSQKSKKRASNGVKGKKQEQYKKWSFERGLSLLSFLAYIFN